MLLALPQLCLTVSWRRRAWIPGGLVSLVVAVLLLSFAANDFRQISATYAGHYADAQYTVEDLRDRTQVQALVPKT